MEDLFIKATHQTPEIHLKTNGAFFIKGISTPDLVKKHYQPMFDWLTNFKNNLPSEVNLILEIDYLNTSSSIVFIDLITFINSFKSNTCAVTITWHYEEGDDDMLELGEHLKASARTELKFIEI